MSGDLCNRRWHRGILLTSRLDNVVLFSYSNLQRLKVMVLVDMDVLTIDGLVLPNEVEAFDGHGAK